jgi:3-deoxy-D-manno-octulosonate 8-phosphate phosphatase (KDO 8-P phosphatase)
MPTDTLARARRVRFLTCDVDGVLTDGKIYVDDQGHQMKAFLAGRGRAQSAGAHRHRRRLDHRQRRARGDPPRPHAECRTWCSTADKLAAWEKLRRTWDSRPDACAHIGDDLPDVPVFHACGNAHAPALGQQAFCERMPNLAGAEYDVQLSSLLNADQGDVE